MIESIKSEMAKSALAISRLVRGDLTPHLLARLQQEADQMQSSLAMLIRDARNHGLLDRFQFVAGRAVVPTSPVQVSGTIVYCRGCGLSYDSANALDAAPHRTH